MNNEFYEDEVIEGFYVPSMLKKAWGAQLDVLAETDAICRRHDIPYFADWGTLLAAIRHGGCIPWDDDLDISMRRRDYERFLRFAEKELPEGFKVMNFKNHPGHHFFVARIVGKPRICFEEEHLKRFHGFPYIAGLDLFVLDNVCRDRKKEQAKAKTAEFVIAVADSIADGNAKGGEAEDLLKQCESYTGSRIDRSLKGESLRIALYTLAEKLFASVPDEESDALVQMMPFGMYGNKAYIPKEYYRRTVRLPFGPATIPVPVCYDAVMRFKFGDYMEIRKAWGGHGYPFFYGQHEQLLETLDFEYPSYKAGEDDITAKAERYPGIKERSEGYLETIKRLAVSLKEGNTGQAVPLQQAAIEYGTLIESVYGEGYPTVAFLEELCELSYQAAVDAVKEEALGECLAGLEESVRRDILERRDIVFIPFASKHWKYMEKLYRHYADDGRYNVTVMPVPYYYRQWDTLPGEEVFDTDYPAGVEIKDYKDIDLENMHPEKIVIQNPFDEWNTVMTVPPQMYSSVIKHYTDELVYIPFFVTDDLTKADVREYINMDHYVCMPGVINADRIILPSETQKGAYIDKIMEFTAADDGSVRALLDSKIEAAPGFIWNGEEPEHETVRSAKKTILLRTSVSFFAASGKRAVDKIQRTLEALAAHSDRIRVIWINFTGEGLSGAVDEKLICDIKGIAGRFTETGMGEYIETCTGSGDPEAAYDCDAYYGDPSPAALKFYYAHKPVMMINPDV